MSVTVGVVGLGVMGSAMSAHLIDAAEIGPVLGYDIDASALARHRDRGGVAAEHGSPTPLFSVSSVIYRAAVAEGRAAQDAAAVHAVLQELAGKRGP